MHAESPPASPISARRKASARSSAANTVREARIRGSRPAGSAARYASIIGSWISDSVSSAALAGNVYGSITEGGKPVPQGVKLEVTCGASKYNAETNASGGFKLFVKDQGKCSLKVTYQGQSPTLEITSFEGAVQYDLVLEKQGGKYTLKRK